MVPINWLAILVASIINMGLGTLWYGPLFGKPWMAMTGVRMDAVPAGERNKAMWKSMVIAFVLALVSNYVLAHIIAFGDAYTGATGVAGGLAGGFWAWLGFMLIATSGVYLWESKPLKLWAIYAGYYLVLLLINGALIGWWM
jgi:hypothetical protein